MGIVTATESRAEQRDIYFPAHERAMAHYSYASPDRRSVLIVEMDRTGLFNQPCRLVPFDGSTAGRRDVGPGGSCTSAAWSPDGKWMYFRVRLGSSSHLWRQRFPDGAPEQITFGPTEEEGLAMAPDGRSLVTSIGTRRSAIWIHDAAGERAVSSEGDAFAPRLSADGTRVFYLLRPDSTGSSAELRSMDLASGKTDSVLPGLSVTDYDISHDEREVAFTTTSSAGEAEIWLASLDRSTPPRLVARGGDKVSFAADRELVFRSLEEHANTLVRIKKDGSGREQITTALVLNKYGVSPDGEWAIVFSPGTDKDGAPETVAIPVHGGAPRRIGGPNDAGAWSSNGRVFYLTLDEQTLAIPVPPGKSLPELPVSGIRSVEAGRKLPGVQVIEHGPLWPGPDGSTYVFVKTDLQRNLFRIQLP
jgi:Tol biopolymer transport system component